MSDSPKSFLARIAGWFSRAEAPGISEAFQDPDRTNKDALVQLLPYVTKDLETLKPDLLPRLRSTEIYPKKMLALYLAEKFMRNEKATLDAYFFARPFLEYCRENC